MPYGNYPQINLLSYMKCDDDAFVLFLMNKDGQKLLENVINSDIRIQH